MKKIYFFSMLLAAGMFASCSSDDVVGNGGQQAFEGDGEMQVALNFGRTTGSRASGNENGTLEESRVKSAQFYFFKADGTYLGTSGKLDNLGQEATTADGNVERQLNVEVPSNAVKDLYNDKSAKVKVIAVLNADKFAPTLTENTSKESDFNKAVEEANATTVNFMMTNSVYADASDVKENITPSDGNVQITYDNVYRKGLKPTNYTPVTMYVERVCSKVNLKLKSDDNGADLKPNDGEFTVKSWALNVTNQKYYPVKKITNIFSAENAALKTLWSNVTNTSEKTVGWSNAAAHRSYWAEDPNYNDGNNGYSSDFKVINFDALNGKLGTPAYCLENTFSNTAQKRDQTTQAVVLTQFKLTGATEPSDIVLYNSKRYTTQNFLNVVMGSDNAVLQSGKYYQKTGANYTTLATADFKLDKGAGKEDVTVDLNGTSTVIGCDGGKKIAFADGVGDIYTKNGNDYTKVTDASTALTDLTSSVGKYTVFVGGYSYYVIPIRHFDDTEVPLTPTGINGANQIGRYGIVRNHTYNLTINSVKNLGNPIEGKTIKPEDKPDDTEDLLMDVTINVLSWAVRGQDIDL